MEDIHQRYPHRWVNSRVEARKSAIEGIGVFSVEPLKQGTVIAVLGGVIIHKSQMEEYHKIMGDVGIQIDDDFFICPTSRSELEQTGVFNHSCEPNIGYDSVNPLKLIAMRDINTGEELVVDYAMMESICPPFECKCKASKCRKIVAPDDWKLPKLQKKYGNYFSPYLRRKFLI